MFQKQRREACGVCGSVQRPRHTLDTLNRPGPPADTSRNAVDSSQLACFPLRARASVDTSHWVEMTAPEESRVSQTRVGGEVMQEEEEPRPSHHSSSRLILVTWWSSFGCSRACFSSAAIWRRRAQLCTARISTLGIRNIKIIYAGKFIYLELISIFEVKHIYKTIDE